MGQKFSVKKLVKKDNFQVIKSDEGVFFGQMTNEEKNGKGIMISERQIYEG